MTNFKHVITTTLYHTTASLIIFRLEHGTDGFVPHLLFSYGVAGLNVIIRVIHSNIIGKDNRFNSDLNSRV